MELYSLKKNSENIIRVINNNPAGSLTGINAPKDAGKGFLKKIVLDEMNKKAGVICLELIAPEFYEKDFLKMVIKKLDNFISINEDTSYNNLSLGDSIYFLLAGIEGVGTIQFVFLIEGLDLLPVDRYFELLGQFRNIREKAKASRTAPRIHFIVFGSYSFKAIVEKCREQAASLIFDNYYSLGALSPADLEIVLKEYPQFSDCENSELHREYLFELSKGCYGIIEKVLNSQMSDYSCENIYKQICERANAPEFVKQVEFSVKNLSECSINIINKLLSGYYVKVTGKEPYVEELFLSGLVVIAKNFNFQYLEIRSWTHEITLRRYSERLFKDREIYRNTDQIIPPVFVLNKTAYHMVMLIEGLLRNLLTLTLAKQGFKDHPFERLEKLGKIKIMHNEQKVDFYNYCREEKKRVVQKNMAVESSALSSYLELGDLENLLADKCQQNGNETGIYNLIQDIFPDRQELWDLLEKFRNIRNSVAHNNLITENTIKGLQSIYKRLIFRMTT